MTEITTVGLDLAKRVVSLCGEDAAGRVVVRRTLRREAVLGWFAQRLPCLVGMEACASAHWFARELAALGHKPRIIAPEFVRPFRLSGKNAANDAAAICAAVRQPHRRDLPARRLSQDAGGYRQQAHAADLGAAHPRRAAARARRHELNQRFTSDDCEGDGFAPLSMRTTKSVLNSGGCSGCGGRRCRGRT